MKRKFKTGIKKSEQYENPISGFWEIIKLKHLYRQGWLKSGIKEQECESVADHTFGTVMLAWSIAAEHFPELDINKVIKLAILHEIGEIHAGDITPSDKIDAEKKFNMEYESVKTVFKKFNNPSSFVELWKEFESDETPESQFVKQIDKLEMGLQAIFYQEKTEIELEQFFISTKKALHDQRLKNIFVKALEKAGMNLSKT